MVSRRNTLNDPYFEPPASRFWRDPKHLAIGLAALVLIVGGIKVLMMDGEAETKSDAAAASSQAVSLEQIQAPADGSVLLVDSSWGGSTLQEQREAAAKATDEWDGFNPFAHGLPDDNEEAGKRWQGIPVSIGGR